MDIKIEKKKGWRALLQMKNIPYALGGVFLVFVVWLLLRDKASTLRVEADVITVSEVEAGEFNDYVRLTGTVQPITTVQLSPLESGVVERIVAEEGSKVKKGDVIIEMSNNSLSMQILQSEADLAENRRFGVQYRYRETAAYTDPLDFTPDAEQPTFDTGEEAPHIVFTPYLKALAHQLTDGIADPAEKAKRIYDYVTLNVRYHYQPAYFVQECLPDRCARDRRGDCGIMALTFITLCRIVGIPAQWQSGLSVSLTGVGCHDWAMFYIAPKGWMYADCSFGASMARLGDETMRRHYFGSLDTGRMVANRAFEAPFDPPMTGFRSDPYDNQSGECEVDGVGLYGDALDTRKELVDYELLEA